MRLPLIVIVITFLCALSTVTAQLNWTQSPSNPILPYGSGICSDPNQLKYVLEPTVIYDSLKGTYRMWFITEWFSTGRFSASDALSLDGVHWYTDMNNPVMTGGGDASFDANIRYPSIIHDPGGYRLYYMADDINNNVSVTLATSPDGLTWQKHGSPVLPTGPSGAWDEKVAAYEVVLHKDSVDYMWYSGVNAAGVEAIGEATSYDGVNWTKYAGNPVLETSQHEWDSVFVSSPAVVFYGGTYYMFYIGTGTSVCCQSKIGMAYSSDGVNWTKSPANPILSPSTGWEDQSMGGMAVLIPDGRFHLYYGAQSSSTGHWEIGLTISDPITLSVKGGRPLVPRTTALFQSYPNPFNPVARIHYELAREGPVSLKVYDMLGREVATLVNGRQPAGQYDVDWNAAGFASGAYLYKISAGNYVDSKKMMLIK